MNTTLAQKSLLILFLFGVCAFSVWSWVLIDPNFTLIKHADWTKFRECVISIGYHQRQLSAFIYVVLIIWLTLGSYMIVRFYKGSQKLLVLSIAFIAGIASYPALSHDLFNYIFDARIFTFYHQNPYVMRPMDFPTDPMLRFMHWIHRTYPYGPSYLLLSTIPSFFGFNIFSLTFFLFKLMHAGIYILSAWLIEKIHKKSALIFATSPLIIIEGLVNSHNDFVAVGLGILGVYLFLRKNNLYSLILLGLSGFVKYITLPLVILSLIRKRITFFNRVSVIPAGEKQDKNGYSQNLHFRRGENVCAKKAKHMHVLDVPVWVIMAVGIGGMLLYLCTKQEIQPWYFLNLFVILPFDLHLITRTKIFFTGLLLSYYPYVVGGEWGQGGDVNVKHTIIFYSFVVNVVLLITLHFFHKNRITSHNYE